MLFKPRNLGGNGVLASHGFGDPEADLSAAVGDRGMLRELLGHRRSGLAVGPAVELHTHFHAKLRQIHAGVDDHAQDDQDKDNASYDGLLHADSVNSAPMRLNFSYRSSISFLASCPQSSASAPRSVV